MKSEHNHQLVFDRTYGTSLNRLRFPEVDRTMRAISWFIVETMKSVILYLTTYSVGCRYIETAGKSKSKLFTLNKL